MPTALQILIRLIEFLLYAYLLFATVYVTIFGISALFYRKPKKIAAKVYRKIAVLIPGYKEDKVIIGVAKDALEQDYPADRFEVIVIADTFKKETLDALREIPVRVVEVVFEVSKKSKALNKCMEVIGDDYDIAVILDADNIMDHSVLRQFNEAFERGFVAVQGHRTAKNLNTSYAVLDAISEEINNSIFRKGHRALGLSSALIGSGMAMDYKLYKSTMATIDSVGEDKEVELKFLRDGITIEYLPDANVFDEKTSRSDVFVNQRRRWLAAQFVYVRTHFFDGVVQLITKGNVDYFDKVVQFMQPPRILLTGTAFLFSLFYLLIWLFWSDFYDQLALGFVHWVALFVLSSLILLISTPGRFFTKNTLTALFYLPAGFLLMLKSLLKIRGASKRFIHTTHDHTDHHVKKAGKPG
ncbi:MAG TPA: glycosyltransferase family 2 protein [Bacteroidales bacterium]|nr:glycosyltransferase family 2 protein [Bacteroidales bacterium]